MFVPVACSQCTKPFQVPEAAIGKPTACPWCQATVLALPVGAPPTTTVPTDAPKAEPPAKRPSPVWQALDGASPTTAPKAEPLSLDDSPARADRSVPAPTAPRAPRSRLRMILMVLLGLFALVLAAGITLGVKRHKQGHLLSWEWQQFVAPDKSCNLDLLGKPIEDADVGADEKRFLAEGWYSGTTAWVGWRDLTQIQVQLAGSKEAWREFERVFHPERDRLKTRYGGTVTREATTKFEDPLTHEVRLEYPGGRAMERMIVMPNGPRPRVYFVGIAGKIDFENPEIQRVFDSLRVTE